MRRNFDVYLLRAVQHWQVRAADERAAVRWVLDELGSDWDVLADPIDPHEFHRLEV